VNTKGQSLGGGVLALTLLALGCQSMPPMAIPFATVDTRDRYFHNDDYTELVGQLCRDPQSSTWRLRYAKAGDVDLFGGSVTFSNSDSILAGYKAGANVRVEGELVDLDTGAVCPAYQVRHIWALN
jgi:hypothetical protein